MMLVGIYYPSPLQTTRPHPECLWEPNASAQKICNSRCHERGKPTVPQSYCKGIAPARRAGGSTSYQLYPTMNLLLFLTALPPSDKLTAGGCTGLFMGNTRRQHSHRAAESCTWWCCCLPQALLESTYTLVQRHKIDVELPQAMLLRRGRQLLFHSPAVLLLRTPINPPQVHLHPTDRCFHGLNGEVKPFFLTSIKRLNAWH